MKKINFWLVLGMLLSGTSIASAGTIEVVSDRLFAIGRYGQLLERSLFSTDPAASVFHASAFVLPKGVRVVEITRYESIRNNPLADANHDAGLFLKGSDGLLYACPTEGSVGVQDRDGLYDADATARARQHNADVRAKYEIEVEAFEKEMAKHTDEYLDNMMADARLDRQLERTALGDEYAERPAILEVAKRYGIRLPKRSAPLMEYELDGSAEFDVLKANEGCGRMISQLP